MAYLPDDGIWKGALSSSGAVLDVTRRRKWENGEGTEERKHQCCHFHCQVLSFTRLFLLLRLSCLHRSVHIYTQRQSLLPLVTSPPTPVVTLSSSSGPSAPTMDDSTHSKTWTLLKKNRSQSCHWKPFHSIGYTEYFSNTKPFNQLIRGYFFPEFRLDMIINHIEIS